MSREKPGSSLPTIKRKKKDRKYQQTWFNYVKLAFYKEHSPSKYNPPPPLNRSSDGRSYLYESVCLSLCYRGKLVDRSPKRFQHLAGADAGGKQEGQLSQLEIQIECRSCTETRTIQLDNMLLKDRCTNFKIEVRQSDSWIHSRGKREGRNQNSAYNWPSIHQNVKWYIPKLKLFDQKNCSQFFHICPKSSTKRMSK